MSNVNDKVADDDGKMVSFTNESGDNNVWFSSA
jgi:hypothetical protein